MHRYFFLLSLVVLSFSCESTVRAQYIDTGLTLSAPSVVIAGQFAVVTATLSVSSGPISATNGLQIDFATPGGGGPSIATLQNGVASTGFIFGCSFLKGCFLPVAVSFPTQGNFAGSSAQITLIAAQPASFNGLYAFSFRGKMLINGSVEDAAAVGSLNVHDGQFFTGEEDLNTSAGAYQKLVLTGTGSVISSGPEAGAIALSLTSSLGTQNFTVFLPYTSVSTYGYPSNAQNATFVSTGDDLLIGNGTLVSQNSATNGGFGGSSVQGFFLFNVSGQTACTDCTTYGHPAGVVSASGQLFVQLPPVIGNIVSTESIGTTVESPTKAGATFTAPDAYGRMLITLAPAGETFPDQPTTFGAYAVDAMHLLLLSLNPHTDAMLLSGTAVSQP